MKRKKTDNSNALGYRDLLTQREYLKMVAANLINRFGDSVDSVSFAWLIYGITGSAAWSAIILGLNRLPTILLQPFTGVLAERWRKKRLMVAADLIRALLICGFLLLYVKNLLNPWVMAAFTLAVSTVEAFRVPAGAALVPKLLERRMYDFGTGFDASLGRVTEFLGIAAGGVLIGVFGIWIVILLDAGTYFLSALILAGIRYREEPEKTAGEGIEACGEEPGKASARAEKLLLAEYGRQLREGLAYIRTRRIIINFCILAFLLNGLLVPFNAFEAALVSRLGLGTEFMSVLSVSLLTGMGLGSFCYPYLRKKCRATRLVILSGLLLGAAYLVCALAGGLQPYLAAAACLCSGLLMGFSVGVLGAALGTEFMKSIRPEYMARCSGVFNSVGCAAMPFASGICSVLAAFCPIFLIFIACGVFIVLLFICMALAGMQFDAPKEV